MSVERIIGVDFGTSTSVIKVKRYQSGEPFGSERLFTESVLFNNSFPVVPTLIQRVGEHTYYGYDAQVGKTNSVLYHGFKVDLEHEDAERRQKARELTQEFLNYLARTYRNQSDGGHLGEPDDVERTVISYPVKWSEETKRFMVEAARRAGFPNVEGTDEAQAAIHAVTLQSEDYLKQQGYLKPNVLCNILLADMGAGTTDLVLCRYTPGAPSKVEVLATWPTKGEALFGGQEVDQILRDYVKARLPEHVADTVMKRYGTDKFKTWKETVVSPALARGETVESYADMDMILEIMDIHMDPYGLTRQVFEKSAESYLKQLPDLIYGCIQASGVWAEDVELVILTGGHSQWYFVKELLAGEKPELCTGSLPQIRKERGRVIPVSRPQETVALGLVYSPLSADLALSYKDFLFVEVEHGYAVAEYRGNSKTVVIPSEYRGKPVLSIGIRAFAQDALERVEIPGSCRVIDEEAFAGCTNLKELVLHEGVEYIGSAAFLSCKNLKTAVFPESLQYIDNGAFVMCGSLQIPKLPKGLKKLGAAAFDSRIMTELTLPTACEMVSVILTSSIEENAKTSAGAGAATGSARPQTGTGLTAQKNNQGFLQKVDKALQKVDWGMVAYGTWRVLQLLKGG